jgi:hypothetical protein
MGGVPVNQVVLQWQGDAEYYKSVPKTDFEMLGLNIRQDLRNPHCYLYQNGTEVDKDTLVWRIPEECLFRGTASPEHPLSFRLPESTSTFSSAATASGDLLVDIERSERILTIRPDREVAIFFVAFEGGYRAWSAIPIAQYSQSSGP